MRMKASSGPARKDSDQRIYSDQDLIWVRCISELIHGHSLTTAGIRRLLDLIPCLGSQALPRGYLLAARPLPQHPRHGRPNPRREADNGAG